MMSALLSCSRGLKEVRVWGTRLEILKNEKKESKEATLKFCIIYMWSHSMTIAFSQGKSMTDFKVTLKGACRVRDLV